MSKSRDQSYLVNEQYKTADNLRARMALHERFSTFKEDFHRWVFEHLEAPAEARGLELGTGPAKLWTQNAERIPAGWQLTLSDLSPGMLEEAKTATQDMSATFAYAVADAQDLPFGDDSFDMVIANHMLYHVPDLDRALAEVRRVLKPGGSFYAATNGEGHMRELDAFLTELAAVHLSGVRLELMSGLSFTLENGAAQLERVFAHVERIDVPNNALKVTEAEPFMAYILSMNRLQSEMGDLPRDAVDALVEEAYREVERRLETGPLHISKATGLFIAR